MINLLLTVAGGAIALLISWLFRLKRSESKAKKTTDDLIARIKVQYKAETEGELESLQEFVQTSADDAIEQIQLAKAEAIQVHEETIEDLPDDVKKLAAQQVRRTHVRPH